MTPTPFLVTPPAQKPPPKAPALLLAHGAGAAMDSLFLESIARLVAARGITVVRFEFAYMAARRAGGKRTPPPKAEKLCPEFLRAIDALATAVPAIDGPLLVGGKSMGGRVASLVAQDLFAHERIGGLVCLGYPFHPPRKPQSLRTAHLAGLSCPTLIVQGEADPLGTRVEVTGYALSAAIDIAWIAGGYHDLVAKAGGGVTKAVVRDRAWAEAADAIAAFAGKL